MPLTPAEYYRILCEHHVHDFSHRQLQVGALLAANYTEREIALELCIADATVARHATELQHKIFDGIELAPSRCGTVSYVHAHRPCCTRACWEMLEKNQFF